MRKTFTLRIDEVVLEKLHHISEMDKRSVNNLLEYLSENFIRDYEQKNGEIPSSENTLASSRYG
jgi:hypothetical protein